MNVAAGGCFSACFASLSLSWGEPITCPHLHQTKSLFLEGNTAIHPSEMRYEIVFPCAENATEIVRAFLFVRGKQC